MRPAHKESAGTFVIRNGRVVAGADPILALVEMAPNVFDLLFPREMPSGTYGLFADGITRRLAADSPPRTLVESTNVERRRIAARRARPAIKARRPVLTLYGQAAP